MGGGDKTNHYPHSCPSVSRTREREKKRGGKEREEESISPRGNPSWRGVNEREREHSLRLMTRSRQREETSDRLSLGKLSARLERVASHPPLPASPLPVFQPILSNAKNLRKVSLLESLHPRIRNGPRWVQTQTSIKKLFVMYTNNWLEN